jgi:hypothetical protein
LFQKLRDDLLNHLIGQGADFLLRLRLNRVLDEDRFVLGHAERCALGMGSTDEFGGCDIGGRDSLLFKVDNIVRTARNAGPSIAERFDNGVTLLPQLGPDCFGSWTCHRWFHASEHLFDAILLTEHLFHPIKEEDSFRLADVE